MTALNIRLFGGFSLADARGNPVVLTGRRVQAFAIYLALEIGRRPSLRKASKLLFGSEGEDGRIRDVERDLKQALSEIPGVVVATADGVAFDRDLVSVDTRSFDDMLDSPSLTAVRAAAELYRGTVAEGFSIASAAFDEWLTQKRLAYWQGAVTVFGRLLAAQVKAEWWESAVDTASRLLALDPTQEVVHRTLMRLQLEQGRPDSALRRYEECAEILRREFGREPSPETQRVREEIVGALQIAPAPREVTRKPHDAPVLVLLVEDDAVSATLVEGFLQEAGYEVVLVADGADALMEIARRTFDLLVMDINIPTLNGLRLFEIMVQKGIETPAVFITGIPGPEVEARSLELGAADFLRKPIRKEVLLPHIRSILQRKQRGQAGAE